MSEHEKAAWWSFSATVLIWLFLAMRFTDAGRIVDLPAGLALETYIEMIVLWVVAAIVPAVIAAKDPAAQVKDERDRAIDALGDRWEGYVVVIAINVLVVHLLARGLYPDRTPSVPMPGPRLHDGVDLCVADDAVPGRGGQAGGRALAVPPVTVGRGRVTNNVRRLREAAGLTQADLGTKVGATRQTIIAIEAEKYAPSLELAFRLARSFGRPFEEVFGFSDQG